MSNSKIAPVPRTIHSKPKRRRKRSQSIDKRMMAQAKRIHAAGIMEAYKAVVLAEVAQKQEEIILLLRNAGYKSTEVPAYIPQRGLMLSGQVAPPPAPAPVENPCVQCGRTGVRKTRPNAFNRTGSWYCAAHQALAGQADAEDRIDNAILGPAKAIAKPKPVVMQTHPVEMRPQEQAVEAPAETPPDALKEAMSQLGVQ